MNGRDATDYDSLSPASGLTRRNAGDPRADLFHSLAVCQNVRVCELPDASSEVKVMRVFWLLLAVVFWSPARGDEPGAQTFCSVFADDWGRFASIYSQIDGPGTINDVVRTPNFDRIAARVCCFEERSCQRQVARRVEARCFQVSTFGERAARQSFRARFGMAHNRRFLFC